MTGSRKRASLIPSSVCAQRAPFLGCDVELIDPGDAQSLKHKTGSFLYRPKLDRSELPLTAKAGHLYERESNKCNRRRSPASVVYTSFHLFPGDVITSFAKKITPFYLPAFGIKSYSMWTPDLLALSWIGLIQSKAAPPVCKQHRL
jgi:hypothetical protein